MRSKVFIGLWLMYIVQASISSFAQVSLIFDPDIPVYVDDHKLKDPWAGGINAAQYGLIDLNGDTLEDLVIYDRSSSRVNTFLRTDGSYLFSPDYRIFLPEDLEGWILFRDYDCDGRKDLFADSPGGMKVFRNTGVTGSGPQWELIADPVLTLGSSGMINLQVNITDVPAIDDVDGDGDLDVLVYNFAIGGFIRYHQNMSVENTGSCGTLDFELVSRNWGYFEECDCHAYAFEVFGETCDMLASGRIMHPGGKSLLLIDMDNDGDKDFLGGHEQCNEFYYLENKGTSQEARMDEFLEDFPDAENPANFPIFPAGFFEDFDGDGIKDLIVSPNTENNPFKSINFSQSSWFYKNSGSDDLPEFDFITSTFIQDGMIELGENASPVLVDEDGDGDLDLLVGSNGLNYENTFYGYITLFENTGSSTQPEYRLKNTNYLDLGEIRQFDMKPYIADLNHDGAPDLVVSSLRPADRSVETRWYRNMASQGNGLSFPGAYIILDLDLRPNDTPHFTDVDADGLTDLFIGRSTGRLEYHQNKGSDENPFFVLEDPAYLGIDDSYIETRYNLVPFVIDINLDGFDDLITSDYSGELNVYLNYRSDPESLNGVIYNALLEDNTTSKLGHHTWITGGLISGFDQPVLIMGNPQGGLTYYQNVAENIPPGENEIRLTLFPNPLSDSNMLTARVNTTGNLMIFNNLGQRMIDPVAIQANRNLRLDIGYMPQGLYLFKIVDSAGKSDVQRFIRY